MRVEKGNETILLVEDEKAILRMTSMMLERIGYSVISACSPSEAIRITEDLQGKDIHLLMTDVIMPEMNGWDLSKKLLPRFPGLKCLFMSGYTADVITHNGMIDEGINLINKPFSIKHLAARLRSILDESRQ
jgi:DNA-binding response OmpR family regulator